MKRLLFIALIALTGCTKEEPKADWPQVYLNNEWVVSEEVAFADTHDPITRRGFCQLCQDFVSAPIPTT